MVAESSAFRWTSITGMRDLNTLMTDAGVPLNGVVLQGARAISGNGQIIVGDAVRPDGTGFPFVVRYIDNRPNEGGPQVPAELRVPAQLRVPAGLAIRIPVARQPPPIKVAPGNVIAGITTVQSQQDFLNALARARQHLMLQQFGIAAPLLGANEPIEPSNQAGLYVSHGSLAGGGVIRLALGNGFSVTGGYALEHQSYADTEISSASRGAVALRYVYREATPLSPRIEVGGWLEPGATTLFDRAYANIAGEAVGTGRTRTDLSDAGRAGFVVQPSKADQGILTAEYGR